VCPRASGIISLVSNNFREASTTIGGELPNFGQQMIGQI
jgi:hypothetical protein